MANEKESVLEKTKNNRQEGVRYVEADDYHVPLFLAKGYTFADIGGVHKKDKFGNYLMGIEMTEHEKYVKKINDMQIKALKEQNKQFPNDRTEIVG